jgi:SRSO17 transposase
MTPGFRRRVRIRSWWRGNIAGGLGKTDNCQIAVALSIANHHVSLPIAYRLYLPEDGLRWISSHSRRSERMPKHCATGAH